jgi:hypothetical protein|tara:strand:+ start:302 stop:529 length:228 start_codon:yes stop_codon:yes gene_type:complete
MAEKKKQVNAASFYGEQGIFGDVQVDTLDVGSVLKFSNLTTTQRNALTAANGMVVYNTSDNKIQVYENGAWANLI